MLALKVSIVIVYVINCHSSIVAALLFPSFRCNAQKSFSSDTNEVDVYSQMLPQNNNADKKVGSDNLEIHGRPKSEQRRILLASSMASAIPLLSRPASAIVKKNGDQIVPMFPHSQVPLNVESQSINIPLKLIGGAYLIYYRVESTLFRAVLDTGSPFLMIPGSCSANTRAKSGCYKEQGVPSGLDTTFEQFDGFEGEVEWRKAPFAFVNATGSMIVSSPSFVFGVADDGIMSGPGGVFFGLIKNTDKWIRPSFLGQTDVVSFEIDLRNLSRLPKETLVAGLSADDPQAATTDTFRADFEIAAISSPSLTLSTASMLHDVDFIPMTDDLRRKFRDPVQHYVAKAKSIIIDGYPLIPSNRKPIYVIFDTGVTGMVVSKDLFDQRYNEVRQRREKRLWGGTVEVAFDTDRKSVKSITAQKPLTTPFDPRANWKGFNSHVLVIGLSFLDERKLVVDIDDGRLWIDD